MYVLPVLTYTQPRGRRRRPRLAPGRLAGRHRAGPPVGARGRRLPVADHPRRGELGVLAGQHGRLPYQRRTWRTRSLHYLWATGDEDSAGGSGWTCWWPRPGCGCRSATTTPGSGFRIDGVTGPDEYSAIADNNVYTNLMAQRNLRLTPPTWPHRFRRAGHGPRGRRGRARAMAESRRQDDHPLRRATSASIRSPRASPATTGGTSTPYRADQYPLLLHFPYFDLYRKQVVKQPDLVFALFIRGDAFTPEEKARNFAYYEALTVRDSSLVGLHPVDRGRRGRAAGSGLRLSGRGRPDRPRRPRAQHPRRPAHRLAGRYLAGPGRRAGGDAQLRLGGGGGCGWWRGGRCQCQRGCWGRGRRGRGSRRWRCRGRRWCRERWPGAGLAMAMAGSGAGLVPGTGLAMAMAGSGLVEVALAGWGVAGAGVAGSKASTPVC